MGLPEGLHLEHIAGQAGAEATGRACTSKHTNNLVLTFPGRQTPGQAERLQALAEVELLQLVDVATVTAGALPERSQRDALSHELVVAMLRVECLVLVDVCLAESFQLAGSEPG